MKTSLKDKTKPRSKATLERKLLEMETNLQISNKKLETLESKVNILALTDVKREYLDLQRELFLQVTNFEKEKNQKKEDSKTKVFKID